MVLIDDDPLVRRAVARTLERAGVLVDALPSAADVADIATRLLHADALITDVVMPGLTGPDLVDQLRRRQCHKPVIFISGYADHELVERVRKSPNSTLVTKPFTADAIIGRLDQIRAKAGPTWSESPQEVGAPGLDAWGGTASITHRPRKHNTRQTCPRLVNRPAAVDVRGSLRARGAGIGSRLRTPREGHMADDDLKMSSSASRRK